MKIIPVKLSANPYKIAVGYHILETFGKVLRPLKIGRDAVVITTSGIWRRHGEALEKSLKRERYSVKVFMVADGEQSKSACVAIDLAERLARYDIMKQPFIIAFGGGVIGDLAGFVASVYKRGIPFVQVPTTFLAQVDAAIGGKTAIDLAVGKNLVGAFYQPRLVFSDVALLKTLPARQVCNGMAEVIKYGIILDDKLFRYLESNIDAILRMEKESLTWAVIRSSQLKARVVAADERETTGLRAILNFGHTLGHAVEAAGGFKVYQHGEAVALGMRMATDISVAQGLLSELASVRIHRLIDQAGLPSECAKLSLNTILGLMKHDKKFIHGRNRFVLVKTIGDVCLVEGVDEVLIRKTLRNYLSK